MAPAKHIEELSYNELRAELRDLGLPAVGKKEELKERLQEARRSGSDSKHSSKTVVSEGPGSPRSVAPGVSKRQRKLIMLQSGVEDAPRAGTDAVASIAHTVKEAAAIGASDLQEAWDAAKERVVSPIAESEPVQSAKKRAEQAAQEVTEEAEVKYVAWRPSLLQWCPKDAPWPSLLLVFLLGVLIGVGLTMLAHPHAWEEAQQTVRAGSETAWRYTADTAAGLGRTWSTTFPRGHWGQQGRDVADPLHCRAAAVGVALPALLPPRDQPPWGGFHSDLRALASPSAQGAPLHKGLGVLLACASEQQCAAAAQEMQLHLPQPCADCLLHITLQEEQLARGSGVEPRGALQSSLVTFLQRCPSGIVAMDAAALAAVPAALPVLITALSEQGHFTADGAQVPTGLATYVILMRAPPEVLAAATDEDAFKTAAKAQFVAELSGCSSAADWHAAAGTGQGAAGISAEVRGLAEVLRRRLELVAPLASAVQGLSADATGAAPLSESMTASSSAAEHAQSVAPAEPQKQAEAARHSAAQRTRQHMPEHAETAQPATMQPTVEDVLPGTQQLQALPADILPGESQQFAAESQRIAPEEVLPAGDADELLPAEVR